jgi:hypothetical protein
VVCLEAAEAARAPQSLRRADGRSVYQRHGGIKYTTRVQLSRKEKLVAQAGARGGPCMPRQGAARALGATVPELEAALHEPADGEVSRVTGSVVRAHKPFGLNLREACPAAGRLVLGCG